MCTIMFSRFFFSVSPPSLSHSISLTKTNDAPCRIVVVLATQHRTTTSRVNGNSLHLPSHTHTHTSLSRHKKKFNSEQSINVSLFVNLVSFSQCRLLLSVRFVYIIFFCFTHFFFVFSKKKPKQNKKYFSLSFTFFSVSFVEVLLSKGKNIFFPDYLQIETTTSGKKNLEFQFRFEFEYNR